MSLHIIDIGRIGPVVSLGISVGFEFNARGLGGPPGTYNGLIDTGSMRTAISPKVRTTVQPQEVGEFPVNRPGQQLIFVPSFDILLKFEGHLSYNGTFPLEALMVTPATPGIDVIIGKDLLDRLSMVYNGPLGKLILMY